MHLFDGTIGEIRSYMDQKGRERVGREYYPSAIVSWPEAGKRDIVLQSDAGLELGHPRDEAVSFLVWTEDLSLIKDGRITLIGPEIGESGNKNLSFGRAVLIGGHGFNEENAYDRHREMDFLRYELSFKGYMMRAVFQYMREWSRVSNEAIERGFSFEVIGNEFILRLREKEYIDAVEILFVTSSPEDVIELKEIGEHAMNYVQAMTRMIEEMDLDCGSCEYQDVCSEAGDMRAIRNSLEKSEKRNLSIG